MVEVLNNQVNIDNKDNNEKKTNIQKCILWCEKYDIPCIKLVSSNNIFLSGIYDENDVNEMIQFINSLSNTVDIFLEDIYCYFNSIPINIPSVKHVYNS